MRIDRTNPDGRRRRAVGRLPLACLVALGMWLGGCDSQDAIRAFEEDAGLPANGITETDDRGVVIREDPDDWRSSPLFAGKVRVEPAWPNPIASGVLTVPVTVFEFGAVSGALILRARNAAGRLVAVDDITEASSPGGYAFQFAPVILARTGLVRLFVLDRSGNLVSYGDVLIQ